jgi:uncharacterized protein (TIGR02145 family)
MPIFIGISEKNQQAISLGTTQMQRVYVGDKLVWQKLGFTSRDNGLLYNWYSVTDGRDIAPAGWHVPTEDEWETLITEMGGSAVAGGHLKEVGTEHWNTPNEGADDSSGFSGYGSGLRDSAGVFSSLKAQGWFWVMRTPITGLGTYLNYNSDDTISNSYDGSSLRNGFSLRLIKDDSVDTGTVTGNDGIIYPTVKIGEQVWTGRNLAETEYRSNFSLQYGNLYNWYAATDARGIAPIGWHVPTYAELQILQAALGGASVGGKKIKESGLKYWDTPNTGTNETGFSARGGGFRANNGSFNSLNNAAEIWMATETSTTHAVFMSLSKDNDIALATQQPKIFGCTIRLLKDNSTDPGTMTDYDGNIYQTAKIGDQVWMAQDLYVEHYNNGEDIPNVTDNSAWSALTTAGMCYYNNDINNSRIMGDTTIPEITVNSEWVALTTGALCAYDNDWNNV